MFISFYGLIFVTYDLLAGRIAMTMNEKENGIEKDTTDTGQESNDPCLRCGDPVEIKGELLCKKCEREVH